ncbi:hypothetical protein MTBBW1_2500025 [Desulfamplus magnetovallimortis]|uniref:Uncharacterized protein n=1 Tax=Desulfamplus magnetovallimortis TaxID=1246637 RepID=A0A1W1HEM0_9BACT|nr:hypothetical protein [Desulfamplus magnetovallimortis]SLM30876.1 hypothetical protein MTBBW1_2500025 [Desulfamplus magnetovallimortis]
MANKNNKDQGTPEQMTKDENLSAESVDPEIVDSKEENLIDDAVKFINEKASEVIYKGHEEIGRYILEKFYDDDIKEATSKNPKKK